VLGTQLFEIQIVVRAREVVDLCDGVGKFIPRDQTEDGPTNPGIRCSFVQQHGAGLLQLLGCSIEVTDRPEPILLPDGLRIGEHSRHDNVEQIKHVIVGNGFQRAHECQQCRNAPVVWQPRDGLGLGGVGEASQRRDAARRQSIQRR